MKTFKVLTVFLVLIMAFSLTSCQSNEKNTNDSSGQTQNVPVQTATGEQELEDLVHLTIAWGSPEADTSTLSVWPTDIAKEIFKATGVYFDIEGMDDEKYKVMLAGGDLPDLLFMIDDRYVKQMIVGEQIIELEDLVKTNGADLSKYFPQRIEYNKKFKSNGTGKLYFISPQVGSPPKPYNTQMGYVIRWDYYKELGYPKFKDAFELLPILAEMQKRHPTTKDGKKVYGVGNWNDWGLMTYYFNCFRENAINIPPNSYVQDIRTNELVNNYMDINAPLWNNIKFMYEANKLGLLDPDTFTMKYADYDAKAKAGQYLSTFVSWSTDAFNQENEGQGFMPIPVEGVGVWADYINPQFAIRGRLWAITKNCKNPDKAMDLINFFSKPDGVRLCKSGIKGVHWDIVDGKPQMLPEGLVVLKDPEKNKKVGINTGTWQNICDTGTLVCEDGEIADLMSIPSIFQTRLTTLEKDFCSYYNVDYPYAIFQKMVDGGNAFDHTKTNVIALSAFPPKPDDINRIEVKLDDIMTKAIPDLVYSKNDAEYKSKQDKVLKDLNDAGYVEFDKWYKDEWNKIRQDTDIYFK